MGDPPLNTAQNGLKLRRISFRPDEIWGALRLCTAWEWMALGDEIT